MSADRQAVPTTYLVFPTAELGGAEKRLLGLFVHLRQTKLWPVELICRRELVERAAATEELAAIDGSPEVLHTFSGTGATFDRELARTVRDRRRKDPRALFHFVLVPPQFARPPRPSRVVFTIPLADLGLYNWRGRSMLYVGCTLSGRVDFLDTRVRDAVARRVPWAAQRFRVTPGSFVDLERYSSAPFAERTDTIVFSGTFLREKGVYRLAEQLPEIDARLKALGHSKVSFRFMGRDGDQPSLTAMLRELAPQVNVVVGHEANPQHVLRNAKVFLSLQLRNNYPSKSLLEAMSAGCVPVVTDVGLTRKLVTDDFGLFVPGDFTAESIASGCHRVLALSASEFEERGRAMRSVLAERFSIDAMANYYVDLYRELAADAS